MPHSRALRVLRGSAAAGMATFVALLSHVASGGQPPGWLGVLVPLTLAAMICTLLAGRQLSFIRLALSVVTSQLLFHLLFVLGTGSLASATGSGHDHGSLSIDIPVSTHAHSDQAMWIGHGIAAIITVVAIYYAERVIAAVIALARRVAAWALRIVDRTLVHAPASLRRRAPGWPEVFRMPLGVFAASLLRRGPPALLTV